MPRRAPLQTSYGQCDIYTFFVTFKIDFEASKNLQLQFSQKKLVNQQIFLSFNLNYKKKKFLINSSMAHWGQKDPRHVQP